MKVVLAVLVLAAAANAAPATLIGGVIGGAAIPKGVKLTKLKTAAVAPLTYSHLPAFSPLAYSHIASPITYSALPTVAVAPAVAPGYVAKTPGATHIAPLPAGIGYASHHINLAAAP